ncbi:MAG: hypothetical protein AB7W59_03325 [Acidimicrobiia bacterium]
MRLLFEVPDPLPAEGDSAAWAKLIRRSAGVRPFLVRAGWRCVEPSDGLRPVEVWEGPAGERQTLVLFEPWSPPGDDELPEPGSGGWMALVSRSHRERERLRHTPGWRRVRRQPGELWELWEHVSGATQRLALWTAEMRTVPDPGVPPRPARIAEHYRSEDEHQGGEGTRWLGSVLTDW